MVWKVQYHYCIEVIGKKKKIRSNTNKNLLIIRSVREI